MNPSDPVQAEVTREVKPRIRKDALKPQRLLDIRQILTTKVIALILRHTKYSWERQRLSFPRPRSSPTFSARHVDAYHQSGGQILRETVRPVPYRTQE